MPPSSSSRQPPEQPGKRNNNQSAKPAGPPTKPFLRFYYSDSLHAKTLTVLAAVEQAEDSTQHRDTLSDIVMELAGSGMDYYYLRPLKLAKASPVLARSARLGINGVLWVMAPVIRRVIARMDKPQLLAVCTHIRDCME
jgi:hypothetical protein